MIFHLRREGLVQTATQTLCGVSKEDVYHNLQTSWGTTTQVENRSQWFPGDAVCVECIRKARPSVVKQLRACRTIPVYSWVVLCGCGGVRPYGESCGEALASSAHLQPIDRKHADKGRKR